MYRDAKNPLHKALKRAQRPQHHIPPASGHHLGEAYTNERKRTKTCNKINQLSLSDVRSVNTYIRCRNDMCDTGV
jgi:hypothetical protein